MIREVVIWFVFSKVYLCFIKIGVFKEVIQKLFGIFNKNRFLDLVLEIMDLNYKGSGLRICILVRFLGNLYVIRIWGIFLYFKNF